MNYRRNILSLLNQVPHQHPLHSCKYPYQQVSKNFCSSQKASTQGSTNESPSHPNLHRERHLHDSNHHFRQRRDEFLREFDDLHNFYFNNLPLRRYAHYDNFASLDRLFNEEFHRMRKQIFSDYHERNQGETQQNKQDQKSASEKSDQNTKQTTQNPTQQSTQNPNQTSSSQQQENQQTCQSSDKRKNAEEISSRNDPLLDIDQFFDTPEYIQDVSQLFQQEQKHIKNIVQQFENSFKNQEDRPGSRTIRQFHSKNPFGEVREFYDSKYSENNYRQTLIYDHKTGQNTLTQEQGEKLFKDQKESVKQDNKKPHQDNQQAEQQTTKSATAQSTNASSGTNPQSTTTSNTSTAQQPTSTISNPITEGVQAQNSSQNIAISPELNDKAKKLSIMLKKEFIECLELARVYQTKSVGQIIDMVLESEQIGK